MDEKTKKAEWDISTFDVSTMKVGQKRTVSVFCIDQIKFGRYVDKYRQRSGREFEVKNTAWEEFEIVRVR